MTRSFNKQFNDDISQSRQTKKVFKKKCRGIYCAKYYGQGGGKWCRGKKMKNEAVGNKMEKKEKGKRKKGKGKRRKGKGGA